MTHYLRALAARLRGLFGDRRADRELDDEIETHLRQLTERYVRQGMTEAEAAWAARRQFGNVTLLQEANREMRGIKFIETVIQDLRYGLWMLRRNPGFTFVAVLTEQDNENAPPVAVINETRARRVFPGEDPIGKRSGNTQAYPTIIGVVADVKRYGLEAEARPEIYYPILQNADVGEISMVVRAAGDPLKLAHAVRRQIWEIDANLPVMDVMSMEQRLAESVAPRRFQMLLFGAFAIVALVIAMVGIYGVISCAVSRRTHEIGIRMALGAQASDVLRMVVWRGMRLALIGVALGVAAALALTRVMKNLLFNVSATDPATFALIALLVVGVALIASYIPARRATKVDPLQALRHD